MSNPNPRGADTIVRVLLDGEVEESFVDVVSSDFNPALEQQVNEYLGQANPTVSGTNGVPSMTVTFNPRSAALARLMDIQRRKNNPIDSEEEAQARDRQISVTREVRFPNGNRVRILLPNCTISDATESASSRTEKTTWAATFAASKWVPLRLGA